MMQLSSAIHNLFTSNLYADFDIQISQSHRLLPGVAPWPTSPLFRVPATEASWSSTTVSRRPRSVAAIGSIKRVLERINLGTMDNRCDWENETQETPVTLFLEHGRQWLRTEGCKDPILGCEMIDFAG